MATGSDRPTCARRSPVCAAATRSATTSPDCRARADRQQPAWPAVTLVVLPTASQDDVTALKGLVGIAGGSVGGTLRAGKQLVDAGDKQLVDELGSQLAGRAKGVQHPRRRERLRTHRGADRPRVGTTGRGGGSNVDGTATGILSGSRHREPAVGGGPAEPSRRPRALRHRPGAGQRRPAARGRLHRHHAGEAPSTRTRAGSCSPGRWQPPRATASSRPCATTSAATKDVSTVDSVDRIAGQVVTILALAGQAAGRSGQYGAVDAADGAMPRSVTPTLVSARRFSRLAGAVGRLEPRGGSLTFDRPAPIPGPTTGV